MFEQNAKAEIERVRNTTGLVPATASEHVIHYSSLPWIPFTALSHARNFKYKDSIPKISFGQLTDRGGMKVMPVSIHVHHALMDGFHVGKHIEKFQALLNQ